MLWTHILTANSSQRGPMVETAVRDSIMVNRLSYPKYCYIMHWYFAWKRGEYQLFPFQSDGTLHPDYYAGVDISFLSDPIQIGAFQESAMLAAIYKAETSAQRGALIESILQSASLRNEFAKLESHFYHILMWYFAWKRGEDALFPYTINGINMDYYAGVDTFALPRYASG